MDSSVTSGAAAVKEMQIIRLAEIAADGLAHGVGRQGACRDDDRPRWDLGHLLGDDQIFGWLRMRSVTIPEKP